MVLSVFLKQTQPRVIVNQHLLTMRIKVEKTKKTTTRKQLEFNVNKNVRNLFKLGKENETIKNRMIRDIRNFFQQEKEDY